MAASPRPSGVSGSKPGTLPFGSGGADAAHVLLVEPWLSGSHRSWAEGLARHSAHRIEVLGRQPAGWRSTLERSAGAMAACVGARPDVLVASSMMDLAVFRAKSGFEDVPTLLYMHENQLTYDRSRPDLGRGAINWRSVVAADRVAFNSHFHLDDFFAAVPALGVDDRALAIARDKSLVLPVGIEVAVLDGPDRRDSGPPVLLWNHRWEADKQPAVFAEALDRVSHQPFRLILAGEDGGHLRQADRLVERFGDRVLHAGFAPEGEYAELLRSADLVVSSADQEFFGVSVAEAMACGAVPLVPDRLAYPELLGPGLAACLYEPGALAVRLQSMLESPQEWKRLAPAARAAGRRFDWPRVVPSYDELIAAMV